ncbi:MAG: SusC/RagA family TonB-linked outer membrane protein, partial [Mangrovibacterium sp.]|nr:SusC/RagA family TonB-linked outer membrane protein [Mangrovibacterium sp.]
MMKITVFLILLSLIQSFAGSALGQNARLDLKMNASLEVILEKIEDQTDFHFFYRSEEIDVQQKFNVHIENGTVFELLDDILPQANLSYQVFDKYIAISASGDQLPGALKQAANQQQKITGTVTDSSGAPLPGVTVIVKGTTLGVVTDMNGHYTLANIKGDAILIFSFVGMRTQEAAVDNRMILDVVLDEESIGIEEVVAVGYGTMKKSDLTGSITSVSSEELAAFPSLGIAQAMQGRASGVQITVKNGEPGADTRVRVRGGTSLNAGSDPLYVVDGFAGGAVPPPEDIESIEILKDASATAIYGSRGANGVILITTKSGKKGDTMIEFHSSYSFDQVSKKIDVLNAAEFAEYINEVYANSGNPTIPYPNPQSYGEGTDWQDQILRQGSLQNYKVSASGGKENLKFYTSVNYYDQKGIVINSDYKRYSGMSNLDFEAGKKLKIGTKMFFQRTSQNGVKSQESSGGSTNTGVVSGSLIFEPIAGIYQEDGSYTISGIGDPKDNPYAVASEYVNEAVNDQFQGNGYVDWSILKGLAFKTTFGVKINNHRTGTYSPTSLIAGSNVGGDADINAVKRT